MTKTLHECEKVGECPRNLPADAVPFLGNFAFHCGNIFCLGIFKRKLAQKNDSINYFVCTYIFNPLTLEFNTGNALKLT